MDMADSLLGIVGSALKWIFIPLGFGSIEATVATFMGLVAKEEVVAVFGVLDFAGMSQLAGFSFLIFNLLCAPCFAAMGAIRREMNSAKWTAFAIGYQCLFAYAVSLIVFQIGSAFTGSLNIVGLIAALVVLVVGLYFLLRPNKYAAKAKKSK
jgi:ferrous iron transport protein B